MAPRRRLKAPARDATPDDPPVTMTPPPPSRIKTDGAGARSTRGPAAAAASTPAAPPLVAAPGTPQTTPRPAGLATAHLVRRPPARATTTIDDLPEELLLKIFTDLTTVGPIYGPPAPPPAADGGAGAPGPPPPPPPMPFRTLDLPGEPHPGLRAYPFLGQVCRRWKEVLDSPTTQSLLWPEVVIDFGHELITAVHTPIRWSDVRPSDDDFRAAFTATRLSADRMVRFIAARSSYVHRLVLANSEGYWSDDGDFVSLGGKHNFGPAHVGLLAGLLRGGLKELVIQHCNDLLSPGGGGVVRDRHARHAAAGLLGVGGAAGLGGGGGLLCMLSSLPSLRLLALEDLHIRLDGGALGEIGALGGSLEELTITAEAGPAGAAGLPGGAGAAGLPSVLPASWAGLTRLTKLELRGHAGLTALPAWLADLPRLAHLDVAGCPNADVSVVSRCTSLRVLSLQSLRLGDAAPPPVPEEEAAAADVAPLDPLAAARAAAGLGAGGFRPVPLPPALGPGGGGGWENVAAAAALLRPVADAAAGVDPLGRAVAGLAGGLAAAAGLADPGARGGGEAARAAAAGAAIDAAVRARLRARGEAGAAGAEAVLDFMDVRAALLGELGPGARVAPPAAVVPARSPLPDLSALVNLTALNLSDNALTVIPACITAGCLPRLAHFDLSANPLLQAADGPLAPGLLTALPALRVLDMRGVHAEAGLGYWSAAKCATMSTLANLAKAAKRKHGGPRVLFDTD